MTASKNTAEDLKFQAEARKFTAEAERLEAETSAHRLFYKRELKRDVEEAAKNDQRSVYHFWGRVDDLTVFTAMRHLERFTRLYPDQSIEMLITSGGGSILDGLALIDRMGQLRRETGIKVTTIALGLAASMAGLLLQAGDTRVMGKEAWLLIHQAQFSVDGSTGEVEDTLQWIEKIQERIVDVFMSRAQGITRKQFVAKWTRKDWWLSADEALKYGFVDEVR